MSAAFTPIIPAKAGTQAELVISLSAQQARAAWIPAFAGMSGSRGNRG